jgi:hypothetical protein
MAVVAVVPSRSGFDESAIPVLDSALFHNFDAGDRERYLEALPRILWPGGEVFVVALATGGGLGPEVSEEELTLPFASAGWSVEEISRISYAGTVRHERHVVRFGLPVGSPVTVPAWLARVSGPHAVR